MINCKKGTSHSLLQSDKIGNAKTSEAVVAGMLVRLDTSGDIVRGVSGTDANDLLGFAINNQTDGDVIESGKIGFYQLDGNSVIETDQADAAITAGNYPVGSAVYGVLTSAGTSTAGLVSLSKTTQTRIIGHVDGVRSLPSVEVVGGVKVQLSRAMLAIKLAV